MYIENNYIYLPLLRLYVLSVIEDYISLTNTIVTLLSLYYYYILTITHTHYSIHIIVLPITFSFAPHPVESQRIETWML